MRRKRPRASKVLLVLSAIVAVVATLVLRGHLARLEARAAAPGNEVPVVVAGADLPRGTVLGDDSVRAGRMPGAYVPPGVVGSVSAAVGRPLAADVAAGEVITLARLGSAGPVASLVPQGFRALPLTVSLPAGAAVPGDLVDVLSVAPGQPFAETVASGVEVLLVLAGRAPEDLGGATTLVVLVTPDTAERLVHARASGDLAVTIAPPETDPS